VDPSVRSWGSEEDLAALDDWGKKIEAWSQAKSLQVYYGEFGVTAAQTAGTGRDKWYKAHAALIAGKGWGGSVWSDGGGHMIYDYNNETWVDAICKDLLGYSWGNRTRTT